MTHICIKLSSFHGLTTKALKQIFEIGLVLEDHVFCRVMSAVSEK